MLTENEFKDFVAQGYNRIPLAANLLADLDTPLSIYLKLANLPHSFLFESLQGGKTWGRYSIIGLPSVSRIEISGKAASYYVDNEKTDEIDIENGLDCVGEYLGQFKVPKLPDLPPFSGGLVGYFGYNTLASVESHLGQTGIPDPIDAPDIYLMLAEEVLILDNLSGTLKVIVHADAQCPNGYHRARERLEQISAKLVEVSEYQRCTASPAERSIAKVQCSFEEKEFKVAVDRCLDYITAGDVFQVVLSQRMSTRFDAHPIELYRALRTLNPSPHMAFMDIGKLQIASSSPEILVRCLDNEVTVRPIAGTRPRGLSAEEDEKLARELLADSKELAEHLMLIDLGRNDVGRVAEIGSVKLTEKMKIEKYSHVMHLVSNVVGTLRKDLSAIDILKASFPAGTLSGAPKIRALEIVEELEPEPRGIYSGAIGYLGWHGNIDTAIAIRTAIIQNGVVHVQAGAGIVADSQPEMEWQETLNKAKGVLKAAEMANAGINRRIPGNAIEIPSR